MSAVPRVKEWPLVVGPGRVGAVLGAALAEAGHRVVAADAVSRERAQRLLPRAAIPPAAEVARATTDPPPAAGVEPPTTVLSPPLHAALKNALSRGDAALTGPVSRGDVRRHLSRIAPESVPACPALARRTADRAIAAGRLRPQDAAPLMDVLAQPTVGSPA